jgi:hypothetical protein
MEAIYPSDIPIPTYQTSRCHKPENRNRKAVVDVAAGRYYSANWSKDTKHTQTLIEWGTRWRSWLRHCTTSRKVAGSIFHCHNPFGRTMALGSTQALTEMSLLFFFSCTTALGGLWHPENRNKYQEYFLGGKGGRCLGLTTLPPSCADCLEIWEPQPPGTLTACPGL